MLAHYLSIRGGTQTHSLVTCSRINTVHIYRRIVDEESVQEATSIALSSLHDQSIVNKIMIGP